MPLGAPVLVALGFVDGIFDGCCTRGTRLGTTLGIIEGTADEGELLGTIVGCNVEGATVGT